jgi:hypothetical protein
MATPTARPPSRDLILAAGPKLLGMLAPAADVLREALRQYDLIDEARELLLEQELEEREGLWIFTIKIPLLAGVYRVPLPFLSGMRRRRRRQRSLAGEPPFRPDDSFLAHVRREWRTQERQVLAIVRQARSVSPGQCVFVPRDFVRWWAEIEEAADLSAEAAP